MVFKKLGIEIVLLLVCLLFVEVFFLVVIKLLRLNVLDCVVKFFFKFCFVKIYGIKFCMVLFVFKLVCLEFVVREFNLIFLGKKVILVLEIFIGFLNVVLL